MKSKKFILSLCVSTLALVSCEQADVLKSTSGDGVTTRTVSFDEPYYVESDGALNFRSIEDYYNLSDSLINLSESEFVNWETLNSFKSYRTFTDDIIEDIYTAMDDDPIKVTKLLEQNQHFVYMTDDSLVYPNIKAKTYQNIVNKDGVFYINGIKNVVDDRYVTLATSDRSRSEHKIAYFNPISSKTKSEQINFKLLTYTKSDNTKRVYADCFLIKNTAFEDNHGANQTMVQFQINVDGKKKRPTGWKHYSTGYSVSQIKCVFNKIPSEVYPNGYVKNFASKTLSVPASIDLGEGKSGTYTANLMEFSVRNLSEPLQSPDCIHFKAETRGTWPEGVGYNYYKGSYLDPEACFEKEGAADICPNHKNVYSRENK